MSDAHVALNRDTFLRVLKLQDSRRPPEQNFSDLFFGVAQFGGERIINEIMGDKLFGGQEKFSLTPKISLEPHLEGCWPDILLESENRVLMVEVKTGADFQDDQLPTEYDELHSNPRFDNQSTRQLLCITGQSSPPAEAQEPIHGVPLVEKDDFTWMSWYEIDGNLLRLIAQTPSSEPLNRVFHVLHELLLIYEYVGFGQMDPEELRAVGEASLAREQIMSDFKGLTKSVSVQLNETLDTEIKSDEWGWWSDKEEYRLDTGYTMCPFYTEERENEHAIFNKQKDSFKHYHSFPYLLLDETVPRISAGVSLRLHGKNDNGAPYKFLDAVNKKISDAFKLVKNLDTQQVAVVLVHDTSDPLAMPIDNSLADGIWVVERRGREKRFEISDFENRLDKLDTESWEEATESVYRVNIVTEFGIDDIKEVRLDIEIVDVMKELIYLVDDIVQGQ